MVLSKNYEQENKMFSNWWKWIFRSHLADQLTEAGHTVTIFDKKSSVEKKDQKFIKGDLLNFKQLRKAVIKNDVVFHFAGLSDLNEALNNPKSIMLNILGTVNLLDLCKT